MGSQGHFLPADGTNARGFCADQLDPKYLSLGSNLSLTGAAETALLYDQQPALPGQLQYQPAALHALKPFPFHSVTDPATGTWPTPTTTLCRLG